ncbi:MAG: RAD52 family DNA repair protein [Chloroflexota bacterium]|nr:RAD52 family DNA repair protein [Chloroflexota bacterium]
MAEMTVQNNQLDVPGALNEGQIAILTQRTPTYAIKQRQGRGGMTFSYVEHAWVTEKLNEAFGFNWQWEVVEYRLFPDDQDAQEVTVLGKLTVKTAGGDTVTKMQFGSSDVKRTKQGNIISIGDDLKGASSDALKKCASLLGLALDLYSRDVTRYIPPVLCDVCGDQIESTERSDAEHIAAWTQRHTGKARCASCFESYQQAEQEAAA